MDWITNFFIAFPTLMIFVLGAMGWLWYSGKKEKNAVQAKTGKIAFIVSLVLAIVFTLQSQMLRPMTKTEKLPEVVEVYEASAPAGEDRMLKPEKTSEERTQELKQEFNFLEKSQEILNK